MVMTATIHASDGSTGLQCTLTPENRVPIWTGRKLTSQLLPVLPSYPSIPPHTHTHTPSPACVVASLEPSSYTELSAASISNLALKFLVLFSCCNVNTGFLDSFYLGD